VVSQSCVAKLRCNAAAQRGAALTTDRLFLSLSRGRYDNLALNLEVLVRHEGDVARALEELQARSLPATLLHVTPLWREPRSLSRALHLSLVGFIASIASILTMFMKQEPLLLAGRRRERAARRGERGRRVVGVRILGALAAPRSQCA